MIRTGSRLGVTALCFAIAAVAGCFGGPQRVKVPRINAEEVADAAIAQYDLDNDGVLNEAELSKCPAFRDALKNNIDKNNDHQLSKEELVGRFTRWVTSGVGASFFSCRVTYSGKPLVGAHVKLVPEEFFGGVIQPAEGTTDRTGRVLLSMDPANLPSDLQNLRAVQPGHYRVEITHPTASIRPKYNTNTTLGIEVSFESGRNFVQFNI